MTERRADLEAEAGDVTKRAPMLLTATEHRLVVVSGRPLHGIASAASAEDVTGAVAVAAIDPSTPRAAGVASMLTSAAPRAGGAGTEDVPLRAT